LRAGLGKRRTDYHVDFKGELRGRFGKMEGKAKKKKLRCNRNQRKQERREGSEK
jgi:hypothetical protein